LLKLDGPTLNGMCFMKYDNDKSKVETYFQQVHGR